MKIIGAGLSKTGTKTLASALRILGYKVYDHAEHIEMHADDWLAIYRGKKAPDFPAMYEGVDAVTDLPAAFWYEEILEAFPDAKVILTVRDNDEMWVQSWVKHLRLTRDLDVFSKLALAFGKPLIMKLSKAVVYAVYCSLDPTATSLFKKKYNAHIERVQSVIPAEKLLVYNVKQGWSPLCQFCGVDVPSEEFPHQNVAGSYVRGRNASFIKQVKHEVICFIFPALLILLSIFVYLFLY